jgi:hypothetical protein
MTKLNSSASSNLSELNLGSAIYNDTISKGRENRIEKKREKHRGLYHEEGQNL